MAWQIEFGDEAERDFSKLDNSIQRRIYRYLYERVAVAGRPRDFGKAPSMTWLDCGAIVSETIEYSAVSKTKSSSSL